MADTVTSNFDFIKPEPGASNETWGVKLNANWDSVDTLLKSLFDSVTLLNSGAMIGMFASTTIPSGWLACRGQAVSRATYTALFDRIGTTFGAGDGSSTFNLPDFRGVFPRGWNDGATGHDPSRAFGSYQADEFKSHTHTGSTSSAGNHTHTITVNSGGAHTHTLDINSAGNHNHSGTTSTDGNHRHDIRLLAGNGSEQGVNRFSSSLFQTTSDTETAGAHNHSFTTNTTGAHTHSGTANSAGAHTHNASANTTGAHTHDVTVSATGGSETRPKNIALLFCIYTGVAA